MARPSVDDVRSFYDSRIEGKLRDFTDFNPRIEAAVRAIEEWAPRNPKRILEIGCGIGATSYRMARAWPNSEVLGADISEQSIRVAQQCFQRSNLKYQAGLITAESLNDKFDFIVLMDVYEHIAVEARPMLHAAIRAHADTHCRVFLSYPTPATQVHDRREIPEEMQPIDEDVTPNDMLTLASDLDMQLMYYREVGIWNYGDFAHTVVGRFNSLSLVAHRFNQPRGLTVLKNKVKSILRRKDTPLESLGYDPLHNRPPKLKMRIAKRERELLASAWTKVKR